MNYTPLMLNVLTPIDIVFATVIMLLTAGTFVRHSISGPDPWSARIALALIVIWCSVLAVVKPQFPDVDFFVFSGPVLILWAGPLLLGVIAIMEFGRLLGHLPRLLGQKR